DPPPGGRARRGSHRDQPGRRADENRGGAAVRVVIAEDDALLREGLALLLGGEGYEVAAAVPDPESFMRAVAEHRPDVAVVDVRMPPTHTDEGIKAAVEARRLHPEIGRASCRESAEVSGGGGSIQKTHHDERV